MKGGRIRLHKLVSNSVDVLKCFPTSDLAKNITEIDFGSDTPCLQKSLGLSWDVVRDMLTFQVSSKGKQSNLTKRGLLSTINGIFDPLGFVAPVVLEGRLIMRKVIQTSNLDWDDPLPENISQEWLNWRQSLSKLEQVEIPRCYTSIPFEKGDNCELHVFSDASKNAIAAVAYVCVYDLDGNSDMGFIQGKSKLAPNHGHTIPRLELCSAVLASELATFIQRHLNIKPVNTYFYTDSQIVLGYINNETRRFYVYVANRVDRILKVSSREQWNYVPTDQNPADHGTRTVSAEKLSQCKWITGPNTFLKDVKDKPQNFQLVSPDQNKEVYPVVTTNKTEITGSSLGTHRFERFSSWTKLVTALRCLKHRARSVTKETNTDINVTNKEIETLILREVQNDTYPKEIECLTNHKPIPRKSCIANLSPVIDNQGLLRVGGRLKNGLLESGEKTPIILPDKHHISLLLIAYIHEMIRHQGRHITEGAIRSRGYWLTSGKRVINQYIHRCVKCRKLRRPTESQKMADLPTCRLTPSPPFTYVGVDVFGPWSVVSRKTRGGTANSKRWAVIFSCLNSRAVHIEIIEEMSSSSFINSLRRFISLRGPVKEFYSDRGTNFVGAVGELGMDHVMVEDIEQYTEREGSVWKFSTPHSSHMNGSWERMIGIARRIIDSILSEASTKNFTHEVLCTVMAEVTAIINSRPITAVSDDPDSPTILTPNVLLTQKLNNEVPPYQDFSTKDMYKSQWRHVQVLADQFWKQWRVKYLQNLQVRKKWQNEKTNIRVDDVVLVTDISVPRIQWPVGVVESVFPSKDGLVRKVSVRVLKDSKLTTYIRPVTQLVHLFSQ